MLYPAQAVLLRKGASLVASAVRPGSQEPRASRRVRTQRGAWAPDADRAKHRDLSPRLG